MFSKMRTTTFGASVCTLAIALTGVGQAFATPPVEALAGEQVIATNGVGGFTNYRIPAIVQMSNGDILISYDGRPTSADAPGPNSIMQRRSTDGGASWEPQTAIRAGKETYPILGYSDPSYVYDEEKELLFNFHVFSKNQGFWGSRLGNDDNDRNVISAEVSKSADNGATWEHRLITNVVKPAEITGQFATSGHGIQIKSGAYKGRLVQQFVGKFSDGSVRAYSVYSDDHGDTWQMGTPVGSRMDENKVVELSDGRLMMNSRQFGEGFGRWISYSEDGGQTWSDPVLDNTLLDPRNNASIIRKNPNVFDGSMASKELLFSNANATSRTNGTVRYSCDNGVTWPVAKRFQTGETSYSDMVALADGRFGLVYEGKANQIRYGTIDDEWLKPFCMTFPDEKKVEAEAGNTTEITITVRNDDTRPLPAGNATVEFANGITAEPVALHPIAPGEEADITLKLNVADNMPAVETRGDVVLTAGDVRVRGDLLVKVSNANAPKLKFNVTSTMTGPERNVEENPFTVGEALSYTFRVESQSPVVTTVIPVEGKNFNPLLPDGPGNCRWRNLPPEGAYNCGTPKYIISQEDVENGFAQPVSRWEMSSSGLETASVTVVSDLVELKKRQPALSVTRTAMIVDENGIPVDEEATGVENTAEAASATFNEEDAAGDVERFVKITTTATNTGNVALTDVGPALARVLPGESTTWSTTEPLTEEQLAAGKVELPELEVKAKNGPDLEAAATAEALTLTFAIPVPEPDDPEQTEPTKPTEPEQTEPTKPTEPEQTEPTEPEQTQPTEPEQTKPSEAEPTPAPSESGAPGEVPGDNKVVTPVSPEFINPSASDLSSCTAKPYATVKEMQGVEYTATVDGKELKATAEGKFVYPYGKTITVKAEPVDGFKFAPDAKTEWSWTAMLNDKCNKNTSKPLAKPLAKTGAGIAGLVTLMAGLGAVGIAATRASRIKRS
ncbi:exo-alpha-sialidase [Gleimia europaea]|uniref:exo-alpha-sialidase n=1 Tax=Gleimia europaea ACS-120-V-Col10b TaxID=883069 RepID=A0A9W5RD04_9ACTO|nr:exo-alpha-sialidase [Gleimia europaea]EPD29515.1 hypothetical protein HMPREF9238_01495 [Gleimia europaea ACS-120-V-Col10b]